MSEFDDALWEKNIVLNPKLSRELSQLIISRSIYTPLIWPHDLEQTLFFCDLSLSAAGIVFRKFLILKSNIILINNIVRTIKNHLPLILIDIAASNCCYEVLSLG